VKLSNEIHTLGAIDLMLIAEKSVKL